MFQSLGAAVISADQLAHDALEDPPVAQELRRWWGEGIVSSDGHVDRKAVAAIVFGNADELRRLEQVLYPRIEQRRKELVQRYLADPAVRAIVLDTPKLFEVGQNKECDAVVLVDADEAIRRRRVESRGWDAAELERREKLLWPLDKKRPIADYRVVNNSTLEQLRSKVEQILEAVLAASS